MNLNFRKIIREGDTIDVSLSSYMRDEKGRYEIVNIDITRNTETGEPNSAPLSALSEIAEKIRDIADGFPSYIFYYFCDNTQAIPYVSKQNKPISVQEYRNKLFSAMFQRHCTDEWEDTEITIGEDFIHLLYRQTEEPYIMEIRKMIEDNLNNLINKITIEMETEKEENW